MVGNGDRGVRERASGVRVVAEVLDTVTVLVFVVVSTALSLSSFVLLCTNN